jgi:signal recognition particle GTPase
MADGSGAPAPSAGELAGAAQDGPAPGAAPAAAKPLVLLFVGTAGSGKTTLVHRLAAELRSRGSAP